MAFQGSLTERVSKELCHTKTSHISRKKCLRFTWSFGDLCSSYFLHQTPFVTVAWSLSFCSKKPLKLHMTVKTSFCAAR